MSATQKLLRFGVFELNLDTEELRKFETLVKLPPQSLKLLVLLASQAGQVVSRDEIQKQLWGEETEVDFEHGVNKCIKQIRHMLSDNAEKPMYIETLPRHGYRFIAPVVSKTIAAPPPKVVEDESGERLRIPIVAGSGVGASATVAASYPDAAGAANAATTAGAELASGSRVRRSRFIWIGAVVVLLALVSSGIYWRIQKRHALTEKDTMVIAEFDNKTGDAVFDGTLRRGLSLQLEQSPFLNLLSDDRIASTLTLMTKPKDARLTGDLAREVCERTGSAATIQGSIAKLDNEYVLALTTIDCRTGDVLADEQATAERKDHVMKALGQAATRLRKRLGESLASIQKYDAPPENVTTASLEALKAYTLGYEAQIVEGDYAAAIPFFQQAISLDSNFAMAYARLATSYKYMGETTRAAESSSQAYALRERVSEREKLYLTSNYEHYVQGDLEAARRTYELWARTYPRDYLPHGNLSLIYAYLGDYDAALTAAKETLRLYPGSGRTYSNLVFYYLATGRFDEAKATAQEAQAHKLDNPDIHFGLYDVAFVQRDSEGMRREEGALANWPGIEYEILHDESETAAYYGQLAKARELIRLAAKRAERADKREPAAVYMAEAALREALLGNIALARQLAREALSLSRGRDVAAITAITFALTADSAEVTRLADDLAKRFPQDTIVQFEYLPMIHAGIHLGRSSQTDAPEKAIEALTAATYDFGELAPSISFRGYPIYLRGQAYLAAHQGSAAAAAFQEILDHPGVVQNEPLGVLAHLGLGRAYALSGDAEKARAAYHDFLTLWKDADPDIPIYKQAKAEYAKLQAAQR